MNSTITHALFFLAVYCISRSTVVAIGLTFIVFFCGLKNDDLAFLRTVSFWTITASILINILKSM